MEYRYPDEFSQSSRARITTEKILASQALRLNKELFSGPDLKRPVREFALRVFSVFAEEAFKLANLWSVDRIDQECREFLHQLILEVRYDKNGHRIEGVICDSTDAILPELLHEMECCVEWSLYQSGLLTVAEAQAATVNAKQPVATKEENTTKTSAATSFSPNARQKRPATESFPNRAKWLQDRLKERGWRKNHLAGFGGPDRKTAQKILDGLLVREEVLEKLVKALNKKKVGGDINLLGIPSD